MLIEIVNDDADEEIKCEERSEYDEDHKVKIHLEIDLVLRLFSLLEEHTHEQHDLKDCFHASMQYWLHYLLLFVQFVFLIYFYTLTRI